MCMCVKGDYARPDNFHVSYELKFKICSREYLYSKQKNPIIILCSLAWLRKANHCRISNILLLSPFVSTAEEALDPPWAKRSDPPRDELARDDEKSCTCKLKDFPFSAALRRHQAAQQLFRYCLRRSLQDCQSSIWCNNQYLEEEGEEIDEKRGILKLFMKEEIWQLQTIRFIVRN